MDTRDHQGGLWRRSRPLHDRASEAFPSSNAIIKRTLCISKPFVAALVLGTPKALGELPAAVTPDHSLPVEHKQIVSPTPIAPSPVVGLGSEKRQAEGVSEAVRGGPAILAAAYIPGRA